MVKGRVRGTPDTVDKKNVRKYVRRHNLTYFLQGMGKFAIRRESAIKEEDRRLSDEQKIKDNDAEDEADVEVYGRVKVRIVSDDADLEVKSASRGDAPLFDIHLTKDGDDWKICDPNALTRLEPFPTN